MNLADFSTPHFYADPYPVYDTLRRAGPVVEVAHGLWATARYDVTNAVLCDRRMGRNHTASIVARYGQDRAKAPVFQVLSRIMLFLNPPTHTRLRALSMKVFTAAQVTQTKVFAEQIANQLIDSMERAKAADIMSDFAMPLPAMVICSLLGVPVADSGLFTEAVAAAALCVETAPLSDEQIVDANRAIDFMQSYFGELLAVRRAHPGSDLISLLLEAEEGDDRLTQEEILANVILFFMAGHETTADMIGNSLIALHRHPVQLDRALSDPSCIPAVVSECLRYDTSAQVTSRTALEDMVLGGVTIPRGHTIFMFLGGANRDPAKFRDPDRLMIDRQEQGNRLISFGGGIHYCLGARLATVELEVAMGALFRRLPGLRVDNLDSIEWYPRNALRGPKSVRVSW
jgi:cytochrome P450